MAQATILVDGAPAATHELLPGSNSIELPGARLSSGIHEVSVTVGQARATAEIRAISPWRSLLPPLIAIALALITKEVLLSLFVGIFSGALFLYAWNPFTALARTIDTFIKRLRQKMTNVDAEFQPIETVRSVGYRFIKASEG
jgi:hypothetical protein